MNIKIKKDKRLDKNSFSGFVTKSNELVLQVPFKYKPSEDFELDVHIQALYLHEREHLRQNIETKGTRLKDPKKSSLILDEVEAYLIQALFLNGWVKAVDLETSEEFKKGVKKLFGKSYKKAFNAEVEYSYENFTPNQIKSIEGSIKYITKGSPYDHKLSEKIFEIVLREVSGMSEAYRSYEDLVKHLKRTRKLAKKELKKYLKKV